MKAILYKALIIFLLVPAVACAEGEFKGKHTKQKRVKKEFRVSSNDLLRINNSYGKYNKKGREKGYARSFEPYQGTCNI